MALKPCKECGQQVASSAKSCPSCGVASPTVSAGRQALTGMLTLLFIGGCWVWLLDDDTASRPAPDLHASARVTSTQVHLTNQDAFAWTNCTMRLNPGFTGSWTQRVARISAGETVEGGLMAFTGSDGERFDPAERAVQGIGLSCDTPGGRASWVADVR